MSYTEEDAENIVYGDHEDFEYPPIHDEITGQGRWAVHRFVVCKRKSDGSYWGISYSEGATEMQEGCDSFEAPAPVKKVTKTVEVFEFT